MEEMVRLQKVIAERGLCSRRKAEQLIVDGKVKVKELAVDFEVTEDCIRKDLTALEKEGLLKRIHGGAMQVRKNLHAYHVDERMSVRLTQKKMIAKKAVELINCFFVICV